MKNIFGEYLRLFFEKKITCTYGFQHVCTTTMEHLPFTTKKDCEFQRIHEELVSEILKTNHNKFSSEIMWTCQVCNRNHYWMHASCNQCSAYHRSTEIKWVCSSCETQNILGDDVCKTCETGRTWIYRSDYNWQCLDCSNINSIKDKTCRKCKGKSGFKRELEKQFTSYEFKLKTNRCSICVKKHPWCPLCNTAVLPHDQVVKMTCCHVVHSRCFRITPNDVCPTCLVQIPMKFTTLVESPCKYDRAMVCALESDSEEENDMACSENEFWNYHAG